MALAGSAVGAALTKLKATLEGDAQAEIVSEGKQGDFEALHKHQDKALTHHYKATSTHTYEVDDSVNEAKSEADDKKTEKTKHKRRGCFSACFGKKS